VSTSPRSSPPCFPIPPYTGQFPHLSCVFRGGDKETTSVTESDTDGVRNLYGSTHILDYPSPPSSFPTSKNPSKCFGTPLLFITRVKREGWNVSPFFFLASAGGSWGLQPTNRPKVCLVVIRQSPTRPKSNLVCVCAPHSRLLIFFSS
jgi:hypothetical protein